MRAIRFWSASSTNPRSGSTRRRITGRLWSGGSGSKMNHSTGSAADGDMVMASVKQQLQEVVAALPDDCTMDDFRWYLYLRQKMEASQRAIDEGRVHTHEEVVEIVKSWRKSYGPTQP